MYASRIRSNTGQLRPAAPGLELVDRSECVAAGADNLGSPISKVNGFSYELQTLHY